MDVFVKARSRDFAMSLPLLSLRLKESARDFFYNVATHGSEIGAENVEHF